MNELPSAILWEYRVERLPGVGHPSARESLPDALSELGARGWEAVCVLPGAAGGADALLFKRRLEPAAPGKGRLSVRRGGGGHLGSWTRAEIARHMEAGSLTAADEYFDIRETEWLPLLRLFPR